MSDESKDLFRTRWELWKELWRDDHRSWEKKLFPLLRHFFWTSRLGMAMNILLGNPTVYKLKTKDGALIPDNKTIIVDCFIKNSNVPPYRALDEYGCEVI